MLQVKTLCPELKLAIDIDNANLTLTCLHCHCVVLPEIPLLKFWKCITIISSNLFTVHVLLLEVLKSTLIVYHHPTFCS